MRLKAKNRDEVIKQINDKKARGQGRRELKQRREIVRRIIIHLLILTRKALLAEFWLRKVLTQTTISYGFATNLL